MTETPVQFGQGLSLVGMLTQPARGEPANLAVLMFNAGVLPRIGPHRLNVKLARALAATGQTSLRFDLSGQGDSRSAVTGGDFRAQAVRDIRDAMDHVGQACGIRRFALIGVCSGAINAHAAALADPRVVGVLMFDGYWYRSRWTRLVRDWKRFRNQSWTAAAVTAALRRRLRAVAAPMAFASAAARDEQAVGLENMPRAEFSRSVQALVNRGVATYFIYSGSVIDFYSYARQFRDVFRHEAFVDHVHCDFCPEIDHTFVSLQAQRHMIERVQGWVAEVQRVAFTAQ